MKRILLTTVLVTVVAGGGWVAAQTPAAPKPAPAMGGPGPRGHMMGGDSMPMGRGMKGGGMMGGGMMGGGMCSMMMGGPDTKIDVKKIDKGVTITLTSSDAATTTRLQKMAEAMRLMHEAMTE